VSDWRFTFGIRHRVQRRFENHLLIYSKVAVGLDQARRVRLFDSCSADDVNCWNVAGGESQPINLHFFYICTAKRRIWPGLIKFSIRLFWPQWSFFAFVAGFFNSKKRPE